MRRTAVIVTVFLFAALVGPGCTERLFLPEGTLGTGGGSGAPDGGAGGLGGNLGQGGRGGNGLPVGGSNGKSACNNGIGFNIHKADVLFSVGRNSSMFSNFGLLGQTRMSVVEQTLRDLVMANDNAINFGYQEFPSATSCGNACCVNNDIQYVPSPTAIDSALHQCDGATSTTGCVSASDSRPVANALNNAIRIFGPDDGGERDVVLIVDGPPGCGSDTSNPSCTFERDHAGQLIKNAVRTHVIAVGPDAMTSSCLAQIAGQAGTGPAPPQTSVYPAADPTQLKMSLQQIIEQAATAYCFFNLDSAPAQPNQVEIFIPGARVDDWSFVSGSRNQVIQVHGAACAIVQAVPNPKQNIHICP
jgi:hypothetical protein